MGPANGQNLFDTRNILGAEINVTAPNKFFKVPNMPRPWDRMHPITLMQDPSNCQRCGRHTHVRS